jgi:hypothetical protein
VQGYGEVAINDYLKGIGEMPSSWGDSGGMEALKAQVVAAASFAFAYTGGGGKRNLHDPGLSGVHRCKQGRQMGGGGERGAVRRQQRKSHGFKRYRRKLSRHGTLQPTAGYEWTSGEIWGSNRPWTKHMQDTSSSANSFAELNERAWDRESPWFYCDWGARPEYNKTAWLKSEEVADIVNAILLVRADSSTSSHVGQPDKPTGDTWDPGRIKEELRRRNITPFNSVSGVSVNVDFRLRENERDHHQRGCRVAEL